MSVVTEVRLPEVGDKVIAKFVPNITGFPNYNEVDGVIITGQLVTVTKVDFGLRAERVVGTEESTATFVDGPMIWGEFYRGPNRDPMRYYFTEWEFVEDAPAAPEVELTEDQKKIADLEKKLDESRKLVNKLYNDYDILCDIITEVADAAGYCDEYDRVVEEVNTIVDRRNGSSSFRLRVRESDHEIEVRVEGTVVVYTTVVVRAGTFDAAIEMLNDDPGSYFDQEEVLTDEVRNVGWDDVNFTIN